MRVLRSNALTPIKPAQKHSLTSAISTPLRIVLVEVPKYAIRLSSLHIQDLGTLIGRTLDSWSANTSLT